PMMGITPFDIDHLIATRSGVVSRGVIPIIGPRSVDQLTSNLAAAEVDIPARQLEWLDEVSAPHLGYPHGLWSEPERVEKNRFAQP
ncbi:MAG TPA: hypothetical protein VNO31_35245, partial [Umezawaea sp.]|nr:hypothetical protein [Umezawaea sp.]